jgi:hypothetical protein
MQLLEAAGVPVIGQPYPVDWGTRLRAANTRGYYESSLCGGINFTTNPSPETGVRLVPSEVEAVAIKIFLPGVRRTERPFLGRVLISVRDWRSYLGSTVRMRAIVSSTKNATEPEEPLARAAYWVQEHDAILEDARQRGYPLRLVFYDDVLATPTPTVTEALRWLAPEADIEAALPVVDAALCTQRTVVACPTPHGFDHLAARLDAYERLLRTGASDPTVLHEASRSSDAVRMVRELGVSTERR